MAVMAVLAGCSSGRHTAAPTTTTAQTASPNPDVVPAVITPAYVDAVFRVLNHVYGNATRELFQSRAVTPIVQTDLRAIFNNPLYGQELQNARDSLGTPPSSLRQPLGDVITTVVKMISASPECVFVQTSSDFTAVLAKPTTPAAAEYWVLRPKDTAADPNRLNPTAWALTFNADYLSPTSIPNQCVA
jgi:hypothetical protein